MSKVTVLASDVIAKIAAGEVVDRPASVVKELLENSLDAGADSIEIHLKDSGKELIHIKDNGRGMDRSDLEQIFQRHATSKIQSIDDLDTLISMGFRGEALYSIAAVSVIEVRTQARHSKDAWRLCLRGGARLSLEPSAPSGAGCEIKVAELFFNTPARRKFLKSNTSETNQILNVVIPYAFIYPQLRILLTHAGRSLLDFRPAPSRLDRAAQVLGLDQGDLLEAAQEFPSEQISLQMILGTINIQRPRRDMQYILVNQRPVESKALSFAANDTYRAILPPQTFGAFILDVRLNPALVDVNIHPTKREVRIKDESRICSMVRRLVEDTLMRFGTAKILQGAEPRTAAPLLDMSLPTERMIFPNQASLMLPEHQALPSHHAAVSPSVTANLAELELFDPGPSTLQTTFGRARYVGAFLNKYLLFEEGTSLFFVDQHAAQERIMFERFQKQMDAGRIETQPLLTPILLKLSIQERNLWDEAKERLTEMGIDTALFDEDTLAIHTQPILLQNIDHAVRRLLAGADLPRCDRATLARRACKASIVSGDPLSPQQAEYQRQQLLACQDPFTCPHGRPTVIELKEGFLDRQFLR